MNTRHITTLGRAIAALVLAGGFAAADLSAQENPIIINRNASFYDNPLQRVYTGKSPFNNAALPAEPAPAPAPKPAPRVEYTGAETCNYLVRLQKKAPSTASIGEEFTYELNVAAACDVADVVVTDTLPSGVSLVSTQPEATRDGNRLVWKMATMNRGEAKTIKITVKPEKEGELVNCATVHAIPRVCVSTIVGKPALSIDESGPEMAQLGADVTYNIVVKNTGTSVAKNVVVTDEVPAGLAAPGGQKQLTFNVGDLAPGASKQIPVTLKAVERGKHCNNAVATSSNAGKVSDDACTTVVKPGLKITKTGTKEQYFNKTADYEIVVSNTGDTTLTGVVVTDTAPAATTIVSASGATVNGNTATWNVGELAAGAQKRFAVKLTSKVGGTHCNVATVSTAQGLRESAEACTLWKGIAAVLLEVVDDPDPVQIGETTLYTIRITNQGTADLININAVANFPKELTPVSSQGGTVTGQDVKFPTVPRLAPKQSITYTITAKGAQVGDSRMKVILTEDQLTAPVVEEESTRVY